MNSRNVYHLWANRSKPKAKSGNTSFEGDLAYSYARCIAKLDTNERGTLVLFGTRGYNSSTTSKHQSYARGAASHFTCVRVPHCIPQDREDHVENLQAILLEYEENAGKAQRARVHKDMWENYALEWAEAFDIYAKHFGLRNRFNPGAAKALATAVKRNETRRKAAEAEQQQKRDAKRLEDLEAWRKGEDRYDLWHLSFVALRLRGDSVETTKDASIPVDDARKLWPVILRVMRGKKDYEVGTPLGDFRLTKIRTNGSIVVGCHDIAFAEIEGIAKQLGLLWKKEKKA